MGERRPILIAGAGIAGLATALALARIGETVEILERRTLLDEAGAGIQIGPNGVKVLRALGVAERLAPHAAAPAAVRMMSARTGAALAQVPLGPAIDVRHGAPYWTVTRQHLHEALASAVREDGRIGLRVGAAVAAAAESGDGVEVRLGDGARCTGRALVGTDGLWSVIARLCLGAPMPRSVGRTASRMLLPAERLPQGLDGATVGLWLGARAHLVLYPVAGGALINAVAVTEEAWEGEEWGAAVETEALAARYAKWPRPALELIRSSTEWRKWALFARPPLPSWSSGRIVLAGDAAHPMLPFLAQGGVMALEDAAALARAVRESPEDLGRAFATYDRRRRSRAQRVVDTSARNGRLYHMSGAAARVRDLVIASTPPQRLAQRFDWLWGYDPL